MWHCLHGTPSFRYDSWENMKPLCSTTFVGVPWHPGQPPRACPALIPLKWHRKQTPVSTWVCDPLTMCSPWTIALWQLVQRSFSPRFSFVMWSWWSKVMFPSFAFPFSILPSWHPLARHAASFTSARGRGL